MTDHRHDQYDDSVDAHALSGAYAVDALDDLERARFEAHLDQCADCREEVASFQETAALLGSVSPAAPPSDNLRAAILDGIESVRPLPPVVESRKSPRARQVFAPRGLLIAASFIAILLVAGALAMRPLGGDNAGTPTASERVMAAADATRVHHDFGSGATATVVLSRSEGKAVIVTSNMGSAPDGKVYELWLQTPSGDMVSAGLMPDRADAVMMLEGDASKATAVGITLEPEGGSPQPTSDPIALFPLAS